MATVDDCRRALERLAAKMSANAAEARERLDMNRSLSCRIPDLDTAFHGHLVDGTLAGLTEGDDPKAKIRITAASDDLIALVDGRLPAASAWASGRVKISASMFDLVKLRKLL